MLRDRVKIISDTEFDDASALMVFSNGVVDFSAAERIAEEAHSAERAPDKDQMRRALEEPMPHSPLRKVSIQTLTRYDQSAACPQFLAYLESALPIRPCGATCNGCWALGCLDSLAGSRRWSTSSDPRTRARRCSWRS